MITFRLNGTKTRFTGDNKTPLLTFLREIKNITSLKDGCSGQATCGACTVEVNGKARLACTVKMGSLENGEVITVEGIPENIKSTLISAFVEKGAVQCGFCTPGILMRAKVLLQENKNPTIKNIRKILRPHLCRCTGYKKIEEAIQYAAKTLLENKKITLQYDSTRAGSAYKKYQAYETASGSRHFVNDLKFKGMLHAALKFSDHPRARILAINTEKAEKIPGVIRVFTADDIPGERYTGLIFDDWPLMIKNGEITNYIGDVIVAVVATSRDIASKAVESIAIEYDIFKPITDPVKALEPDCIRVHEQRSNLLETCSFRRGNLLEAEKISVWWAGGHYETQRIEHAFMETESAVAVPEEDHLILYSQGQGIYEDRRQIATLLGISDDQVRVIQVQNGGGFGGKEDLSVQGHAALFARLLNKPVKLTLSREESIRMHPKRHPIVMDIKVGCSSEGYLTYLTLKAVGDTGAYASVGNKVLERLAGHATGGYYIPVVDIDAKTVYTNNIPSGAMRGFGVPQVVFAIESCIEDICKQAGFDPWQFRFVNALSDGDMTATGQVLKTTGIEECLLALKDDYDNAKFAGLATGIKNCGVGNAMPDLSRVKIEIKSADHIIIHHGWSEMGQGVHTMAIQTLCNETDLPPDIIEVKVDSDSNIKTGMTTSSRATMLVGNAIIEAAKQLKKDLAKNTLPELVGKIYSGAWICDWTTKPGEDEKKPVTHFAYGYAAQLCILDEEGNIEKIVAAHDGGKIMNPILFDGQIEGAVHMGTGYALKENLPMEKGLLYSEKLKDCGVLRAHETPAIIVKGIEVKDEYGPYGAKGIGEIGMVPTAAAIANAYFNFDGKKRYRLPLEGVKKKSEGGH